MDGFSILDAPVFRKSISHEKIFYYFLIAVAYCRRYRTKIKFPATKK